MRAAFRLLAEAVLNHGAEYRVAQAFSELTITTRKSPLSVEEGPRSGLRAGDRALDAPLNVAPDAGTTHLYDLLYRGGWTLLAFSGRDKRARPAEAAAALASFESRVTSYLIAAASPADAPDHTIWDLDGETHRRFGITTPRLVLVRPDGHIAVRATLERRATLDDYLTKWGVTADLRFQPKELASPASTTATAASAA